MAEHHGQQHRKTPNARPIVKQKEEYMEKKTLSGMTLAELENVAYELGMPKYASKQIATWLYTKQIFILLNQKKYTF